MLHVRDDIAELANASIIVSSPPKWTRDIVAPTVEQFTLGPHCLATVQADAISMMHGSFGAVMTQFKSPAFRELTTLWNNDGSTLRADRSLADWAGSALQKHGLVVTTNFDAFVTDALAHAGWGLSHLEHHLSARQPAERWPTHLDSQSGISVHMGRRPLSAGLLHLLTRTRIRAIWRGVVRWANKARGELTLDQAIRQFLKVLRSRLGRQAHQLLVEHDQHTFTSTRTRIHDYEFRVGNPPPVDAHAAVDRSSSSMHVAFTPEVIHEQVCRLEDAARPRNWVRARRAEACGTSRAVVRRPVAGRARAT